MRSDLAIATRVVAARQRHAATLLRRAVNAIDACSPGGHVRARTRDEGSHVAIVVEDDGSGIAPEIRDRIFDPFFSTRGHGGGVSLGLSITAANVQEHHGTIAVEPAPGGGTRVTVRLPCDIHG